MKSIPVDAISQHNKPLAYSERSNGAAHQDTPPGHYLVWGMVPCMAAFILAVLDWFNYSWGYLNESLSGLSDILSMPLYG